MRGHFQSVLTTVVDIVSGDSPTSTDVNDSPASATKMEESIVLNGRWRRSATMIKPTDHDRNDPRLSQLKERQLRFNPIHKL